MPSFDKNSLNFSSPTFCAILTDPMFPDLIKISSVVKFDDILLSYSLIENPAHFKDFGKLRNFVSGSIICSFKPAATVKVLKTEPYS